MSVNVFACEFNYDENWKSQYISGSPVVDKRTIVEVQLRGEGNLIYSRLSYRIFRRVRCGVVEGELLSDSFP